jgi:hypothetical protein
MFALQHGSDFDEEVFDARYGNAGDPQFRREAARLKDRFFERIEGTIRSHRKMLTHFFRCRKCLGDGKNKETEEEESDEAVSGKRNDRKK